MSKNIRDYGNIKYVGYDSDMGTMDFFSTEHVQNISKKITELLMGVDPYNRPIIVPDNTILSVMNNIYSNFRPQTGDIYGRYNIPTNKSADFYLQNMTNQTIEVIVTDVTNNYEMEQNNKKLSIWTTVLGDFTEHNLRSHPKIKIREKRPAPMQFKMNY